MNYAYEYMKYIFKIFFLLLFVAYTATNAFFTHIHVVNHTVYIHNHPYKKSEKKTHTHSAKEMLLLQEIAHMPFAERVVEQFNFSIEQPLICFILQAENIGVSYAEKFNAVLLRAPPYIYTL